MTFLASRCSILVTLQHPRSQRSVEHPVSWVSAVAAIALLAGGVCSSFGELVGATDFYRMQVIGVLGGLVTALCSRLAGDLRSRARSAAVASIPARSVVAE